MVIMKLLLFLCILYTTYAQTCDSVQILSSSIDAEIADVIYKNDGEDDEVIFIQTRKGTVYESYDLGKSWNGVSLRLANYSVVQASSHATALLADPDRSAIGVYDMFDAQKDVVIFQGYGKNFWVSEDSGITYDYREAPFAIISIMPHPTNERWIAVRVETVGCYKSGTGDICGNMVFFSEDLGVTWVHMRDYVRQFSWGNAGKGEIEETAGYFIYHDTVSGDFRNQGLANIKFSYSPNVIDDASLSYTVDSVVGLIIDLDTGLVLIGTYESFEFKLHVSSDNGINFSEIKFPSRIDFTRVYTYYIIDISFTQVLLGVEYLTYELGSTKTVLDVLLSDLNMDAFDLVLPNIVVGNQGPNLESASGMPGIYFANVWTKIDDTYQAKTVITYNHGVLWYDIASPGQQRCDGDIDCYRLNLYFYQSNQNAHSTSGAKGLILATGQVGLYLDSRGAKDVYVSRDSGVSWKQILNGAHVVEYTASGSVFLALQRATTTSATFEYSLNQGITMQSCAFAKTGVVVKIYTDDLSKSSAFFAEILNGESTELVHFDFGELLSRDCGPDDYEVFNPRDPAGRECILGRNTTYVRRKSDAICMPNVDDLTSETNICDQCTFDDYMCKYCYSRDTFSLNDADNHRGCHWDCTGEDPSGDESKCIGFYTPSINPYEKSSGSACTIEIDWNLPENALTRCDESLIESEINEEFSNVIYLSNFIFGLLVLATLVTLTALLVISYQYYYLGGHDLTHDE